MNSNHVFASDVANKTVDGAYVLYSNPKDVAGKTGPIYFRTENPAGYQIEGLQGYYLLGYVTDRKSNLVISTVNLVAPDGMVYSHDSVDTNETMRLFAKLQAANLVTFQDLGSIYVED